jgi:hypothetical protein
MHNIRRRVSYANVVATLALFVALGGSSYAALTVTGKQVKNGSLTGKDVKNRSLGATELSAKAKGALRGNAGAQGPQGLPGPQGPIGSSESNAVVRRDTDEVSSNSTESVDAYCLPGERAIGGGASGVNDVSFVDLHSLDFVDRDGDEVASGTAAAGVYAFLSNSDTTTEATQAWVVCAR